MADKQTKDTFAQNAVPAHDVERQKQMALNLINDIWDEASDEGINLDCLSHVALFQALSSLVVAYGEEAVTEFCKDLPARVQRGDFTLGRTLQ
jgi:hypothetical protein